MEDEVITLSQKRKERKLGLFLFTELQHSASQFSVLPVLGRLMRSQQEA